MLEDIIQLVILIGRGMVCISDGKSTHIVLSTFKVQTLVEEELLDVLIQLIVKNTLECKRNRIKVQ